MLPLHRDPHFTFHFAEDRIVPRFHLEDVPAGMSVRVYRLDAVSGVRLDHLASAVVGEGGWVELGEPLRVSAGSAFLAVPGEPTVRLVCEADQAEWLRMRALLWPEEGATEHHEEIAAFFASETFRWAEPYLRWNVFVAVRPEGGLCGFAEASIRPFVDGCYTRPVGYLEGWYVDADLRRLGVAKRLEAAAEQWAAAEGCQEMASDTWLWNTVSQSAHQAIGFEETNRLVHFRKKLAEPIPRPEARSCEATKLRLLLVDGLFAVCKLPMGPSLPAWATQGDIFSITRTADELSVVCRQGIVPEGIVREPNWRCLRVAGSIPFTVIGVLASLTTPLAKAGISVFAVSTFDTDYLLFKANEAEKAIAVLLAAGHSVDTLQI